jgi:hypothetical protein
MTLAFMLQDSKRSSRMEALDSFFRDFNEKVAAYLTEQLHYAELLTLLGDYRAQLSLVYAAYHNDVGPAIGLDLVLQSLEERGASLGLWPSEEDVPASELACQAELVRKPDYSKHVQQ